MSTFIRLTDYKSSDAKEEGFFKPENRYEAKQEDFAKIPGSPVAYWVSERIAKTFNTSKVADLSDPRLGMATADNNKFLRFWQEINKNDLGLDFNDREDAKISNLTWFPYQKGGDFRKWFGNNEYVVNWKNDGAKILSFKDEKTGKVRSHNYNLDYIFKKGITWNALSSNYTSMRISNNSLFDNAGSSMFLFDQENYYLFLSFMNTKIMPNLIKAISPTMNYQPGDIASLPIIFPKSEATKQAIDTLTQECIDISKEEWDSRETSWDFKENGLLRFAREIASTSSRDDGGGVRNDGMDGKIESAYNAYCNYWREKFTTLHANEEELNRLFIDIYELQDELSWHVELKDITILKQESDIVDDKLVFDADEIMKQFVSYGVGCMFGRYSLDKEGLWIANMGQDVEILNQVRNDEVVSFEIDDDNIIPVLEDDYFKDDMASRFVQFVKVTFGEQNLRENIRFIESSLGTSLRKYFVKGFYEDHLKRYKKRPIYWMVSSPKKGFMSLIYMHRYQSDTFARVRNSYLTEYIAKLEAHKDTLHLTTTSDTASDKDKKDADKRIKDIETKLKELIAFDRDTMMHFAQNNTEIDLDDGVKGNYSKFREILYEIKGLNKDE